MSHSVSKQLPNIFPNCLGRTVLSELHFNLASYSCFSCMCVCYLHIWLFSAGLCDLWITTTTTVLQPLVQFMWLTVFLYNLSPSPIQSTSWSGTVHFVLHTFLHSIIVFFFQHIWPINFTWNTSVVQYFYENIWLLSVIHDRLVTMILSPTNKMKYCCVVKHGGILSSWLS